MRTNLLIIFAAVLIVIAVFHNDNRRAMMQSNKNEAYNLNLTLGNGYETAKPVTLAFTIQDDKDTTYKDFDRSNPIPMMVTVIRKDRTNFQHVHPGFNQATGTFTINQFVFPGNGEYRVFASFRGGNDKRGEEATTAYQDVQVGDMSQYTPQPIGSEQLTSSANGYDTTIVPYTDDNNHSLNSTKLMARQPSTVAIKISQNGRPVTNLDDFKGSVGRLTAFGLNLEFVGTNSVSINKNNQSGLMLFNMSFPAAGIYKLYMEVQVNKVVTTFEYTITVNSSPNVINDRYKPMQNINYLGL